MNKYKLYLLLASIIVASIILAACSGTNNPPPEPTATAAPTEIVWPDWSVRSCNTGRASVLIGGKPVDCSEILNGEEPNNVPTLVAVVTEPPAATATATEAPAVEACAQNWTRNFSWANNIDWGDNNLWTQYYAQDQSGHTVLVRVEPGLSIDNEEIGTTFNGKAIQTTNTAALNCLADEFMAAHPNADKVWIGLNRPAGWDAGTDYWTWKVWPYIGMVIDTAPSHWETVSIKATGQRTFCAANGVIVYGQVWNSTNTHSTQDFILTEGQITLPDNLIAGSVWIVNTNGAKDKVMARFVQMTWMEHVIRDDLSLWLTLPFFGTNQSAPLTWEHAESVEAWDYVNTCTP